MSLIKYLFVTDFTEQEVYSTPVQGDDDQQLKQQALKIASENLKEEDRQYQQTLLFKEKIYIIFALKNENQYLGILVTLKSYQQYTLAFNCIQDVLDVVTKIKNQEQNETESLEDKIDNIFEEFLDNIENQKEKTIVVNKGNFKNEFLVEEYQIENFSDLQSQLTDNETETSIILDNNSQKDKQRKYIFFLIFLILLVAIVGLMYFGVYMNQFIGRLESGIV